MDGTSRPDPPIEPRSWATTAAAVLAVLTTLPYLYVAWELALITWGDRRLDPHSARALGELELSAVEAANLLTMGSWIIAVVSTYVIVLAVNLLRRREWARHAALLTFLFFGVVLLPMSIAGLTYDPPARNAWLGFIFALADLGVFALLLTPGASDDFGDAEWLRRHRAREGERRRRALTSATRS